MSTANEFIESYQKNPYWCVDCGAKMIPCPSRSDGADSYVGFYSCSCQSGDPFGHKHSGKFGKFPNQHPLQPALSPTGDI